MHVYLWIMTQIPWKKNAQATSYKSRDPTRINIINTQVPGDQSHTGEQINRSQTKTGTQLSLTNSIHTRWACSRNATQLMLAQHQISSSGIQVLEWMETTELSSEPTFQWDASSGVHQKLSKKDDQANRILKEK